MLSLRAHAKVNLALSVGPPEPQGSTRGKPGWHPISSWMHAIELADRIDIAPLEPGQTTRFVRAWGTDAARPYATTSRAGFDWPLEKDLIVRAHTLMEQRSMRQLPAAIAMTKLIPDGAGLGGGSSDAACVMLGLNRVFALGFSAEQLRAFSTALGSDVAFFIDEPRVASASDTLPPPRPAIVSGFGDRLERLGKTQGAAALVFPGFGCPTPAVYKAYDIDPKPLRDAEVRALVKGAMRPDHPLFNDLTPAAARVEPRLTQIIEQVQRLTARPAHMSGSGSTIFVLAKDDTEARALAVKLVAEGLTAVPSRFV